ncbi:MAG: DEAD/DEAH box helicase [Deltaproteobacteria bacterium]|nr:DEAD/DEAH box helicase [Deltaproteobacteria bacterium]
MTTPTSATPDSNKLLALYEKCNNSDKIILSLLTLNIVPLSQVKIIYIVRELLTQPAGGDPIASKHTQQTLIKLEKKGLIKKSDGQFSCPRELRIAILVELLQSKLVPAIGKVLQMLMPNEKNYKNCFDHDNFLLALRDLQLLILTNQPLPQISEQFNFIYHSFGQKIIYENPFQFIFNQPFAPELLAFIDNHQRAFFLFYMLAELEYNLEPSQHIIDYIEKNELTTVSDTMLYAHSLINHGYFDKALAALKTVTDDHTYYENLGYYTGRIAFLRGDQEKALEHYHNGLNFFRKKTGLRKKILPHGYDAVFFLMTLLKSDEVRFLEEGLEYIKTANKEGHRLESLINSLQLLFRERLGLSPDTMNKVTTGHLDYYTEQEKLLYYIVINWNGVKGRKDAIPELVKIRQTALTNNYFWIAAEASTLLSSLGHNPEENLQKGEELHQRYKSVSIVDLITAQPKWEKILNTLSTIGRSRTATGNEAKKADAEERLIWHFSYYPDLHRCEIKPRVQKMTKSGNWSNGRPAALKTLFRESGKMQCLSSQDRAVLSCIKEERYGYYRGNPEYDFDYARALPKLIGHPLIFLENNPRVQIELVAGKADLKIEKKKNGKIALSLEPFLQDINEDIIVQEETPTRFRIIEITPEYSRISNVIGARIILPGEAEKLARETAVSLSGIVSIQSDLISAAGEAVLITADPRPHIHLIPYQDGIHLQFLVKPFIDKGSSLKPGSGGRSVLAEIDGKKMQAQRDLKDEARRVSAIIEKCPTLQKIDGYDGEWLAEDPQDALELLFELKNLNPDEAVLEWPQGEKLKVRRELSFANLTLKIKRDHDWFKACGNLKIDEDLTLNLQQLMAAMENARGRFLPLDETTFIALTSSLKKRLKELAAYTEKAGHDLRFNPLASLAMSDLTDGIANFSGDKAWQEHQNRLSQIASPEPPSTLQAQLRDYQMNGFKWLAQLSHWQVGACLADDMGLGKTIQALAVILTRAAQGPTLVVAPLSVINNWNDEAQRFAPTLKPLFFGPGDRQKMLDEAGPFDLIICSYGLMLLEAEKLVQVEWQTVVLDEAQAIKNMQTKRSQTAMQLQAKFRLVTTGTPVENHLGELWNLFTFLNPGLLGSYKKFQEKFAQPIERDRNMEANRALKKLIQPFILRRLKSDVLQELPAKTEITLKVEMSPEEASLYEAQRLNSLESLQKEESDKPAHLRILVEIMKLRRLCCNPQLLLPGTSISSSKLKVFADTVSELLENRHKALVFSQFVDHLGLMRKYLDQEKISYQYLDGSTPLRQRQKRINDFQNGIGDLFLISLKAGGSGLNLTAADYVIHMDPWWNPAVEDQASDRAHRIGQERPVTVYRLIVKDSIEEQIVELHQRKRNLADNLLAGSDLSGKLDASELLKLLQQ